MPGIGFGLLWGGYTLVFWGYCQVKGYAITLGEIVIPKRFTGTWPPPLIDDGSSSNSSAPYGGQLGGGPGNPATGGNGVAPGQHPGDAPWSYQGGTA